MLRCVHSSRCLAVVSGTMFHAFSSKKRVHGAKVATVYNAVQLFRVAAVVVRGVATKGNAPATRTHLHTRPHSARVARGCACAVGMRTWHLLLLTTTCISLMLMLREAPISPQPVRYAIGGAAASIDHVNVAARAPAPRDATPASSTYADHMAMASKAAALSPPPPPLPQAAVLQLSPAVPPAVNASVSSGQMTTVASVPWRGGGAPFIVLGIVSNCMWGNSFDRRKWIRETWKTYANVGKTIHVVFIVALLQSDLSPVPASLEARLRSEADEHRDMLLLTRVPERKSPCLKTMAWFRYAAKTYPDATFLAKTDDDAFVQTIKLEANMRPFARQPQVYIGSTLWGSYITQTFQACARRMGPNMCAGGMKEERCKERGAIGPFPYAVGMLQVLSHRVASWMVDQPNFLEFERRATAATRPPMMDHGEDMVIGMFLCTRQTRFLSTVRCLRLMLSHLLLESLTHRSFSLAPYASSLGMGQAARLMLSMHAQRPDLASDHTADCCRPPRGQRGYHQGCVPQHYTRQSLRSTAMR